MKKPNRSNRQFKKLLKNALLRLAHTQPEYFSYLMEQVPPRPAASLTLPCSQSDPDPQTD